jgi:hypothetical protein
MVFHGNGSGRISDGRIPLRYMQPYKRRRPQTKKSAQAAGRWGSGIRKGLAVLGPALHRVCVLNRQTAMFGFGRFAGMI